MLPAEKDKAFGAPGQNRPAVLALDTPKASAPRLHQRNMAHPQPQNQNPRRGVAHPGVKALADFFGASPVASALGSGVGRDPGAGIVHPTTPLGCVLLRAELSTLLGRGTFYFALTANSERCQKGVDGKVKTSGFGYSPAGAALTGPDRDAQNPFPDKSEWQALLCALADRDRKLRAY